MGGAKSILFPKYIYFKKPMKINEEKINTIIENVIRGYITENYHGYIYHYTTLPNLYCIIKDNAIFADYSDSQDFINTTPRRGTETENGDEYAYICFTRDKNYDIREGSSVKCRLTFDADKLMTIRYAHLYPVNWSGQSKVGNASEFEERLYGVNVYPFNKYIERIDIIVNDMNGDFGDGGSDLEDELYDKYKEKYPDAPDDKIYAKITKHLLKYVVNNKRVKGKVFVHGL